MLTFALAVFFLIITPGPGVLSTAGVGSAYGFRPGLGYVTGLFIGTNLVALRRLDLSETAHRRINFAMTGSMLAVVVLASFATLRTG